MTKLIRSFVVCLVLTTTANAQELEPFIASLIPALISVESNGNASAIGDNGRAYGQLQIWQAVVTDVNRIAGTQLTHEDAFDMQASQYMCVVYLKHYGKHYMRTTGKPLTYEVLSRMWNGGPYGYKKASTVKYWTKVKQALSTRVGL